jgi:hypothetical protein
MFDVAGIITALAAIITALAAYRQITEAHRSAGANLYYQLENQFYHSNLMRDLRKRAAIELCSTDETFDAFDDLGDFFDFIGTVVKAKALSEPMAWSSYYRRATAFWHRGLERGAIAKARKGEPNRWDDFEYLVRRLEGMQARKKRGSTGKLTEEQINILFEQERRL